MGLFSCIFKNSAYCWFRQIPSSSDSSWCQSEPTSEDGTANSLLHIIVDKKASGINPGYSNTCKYTRYCRWKKKTKIIARVQETYNHMNTSLSNHLKHGCFFSICKGIHTLTLPILLSVWFECRTFNKIVFNAQRVVIIISSWSSIHSICRSSVAAWSCSVGFQQSTGSHCHFPGCFQW